MRDKALSVCVLVQNISMQLSVMLAEFVCSTETWAKFMMHLLWHQNQCCILTNEGALGGHTEYFKKVVFTWNERQNIISILWILI